MHTDSTGLYLYRIPKKACIYPKLSPKIIFNRLVQLRMAWRRGGYSSWDKSLELTRKKGPDKKLDHILLLGISNNNYKNIIKYSIVKRSVRFKTDKKALI